MLIRAAQLLLEAVSLLATPREVVLTPSFDRWLEQTRASDKTAASLILKRIDRVRAGNFGSTKKLGHGVSELKIDFGPGYRLYYGESRSSDPETVVLVHGGTKRTQDDDIVKAKALWSSLQKEDFSKPVQVEVLKPTFEDFGQRFMPKPWFRDLSDDELLAVGVPEEMLVFVRDVLDGDEESLVMLADQLPDQAAEFLLERALSSQDQKTVAASTATVLAYCKLIEVRSRIQSSTRRHPSGVCSR